MIAAAPVASAVDAVTCEEVIRALRKLSAAQTAEIVYGQTLGINHAGLVEASQSTQDVAPLIATVLQSVTVLNKHLFDKRVEANKAATSLSHSWLTTVFGQQVPGLVTLPYSSMLGRTKTVKVEMLECLTKTADGSIWGTVRTDGVSHEFTVVGGKPRFEEPIDL